MKTVNIKKAILPNLPYAFIALYATKLGQAARLAPGADFSQKSLHLMEGFAASRAKTPRSTAKMQNTGRRAGAIPTIYAPTSIPCLKTTSSSPRQSG